MNIQYAQDMAVLEIGKRAKELGITGVAVALIRGMESKIFTPTFLVVEKPWRDPDPSRGEDDSGFNYLAVAWSKIAQMLDTLSMSGPVRGRRPKLGEFDLPGGWVSFRNDFMLLASFSGSTSQQDIKVARPGLQVLIDLLPEIIKASDVPTINHTSIWINSLMTVAVDFFGAAMGYQLENNRNPKWDTGQARFMLPPGGIGAYIQLTIETAQRPNGPGSAHHVAFATPNVMDLLGKIQSWCRSNQLLCDVSGVGGGKFMVKIPDLFYTAFEIIPV